MSTFTAIGFANKFYTLWSVEKSVRTIRAGQNEEVTRYTYHKNISFDKETALAKYPDAIFIEDLRGKTQSWDSVKVVYTDVNTFRFGKYNGMDINECTDNSYLEWYWENVYTDHKEYVGNVLVGRGYEIRVSNSTYTDCDGNERTETSYRLMSPQSLEQERIEEERMQSYIKQFESGNAFVLNVEYNPNEEGYYRHDNVLYKFAEVGENYYKGYPYYLPILNGKQKRVKGKTIVVKSYDYTYDNNLLVNIHDFEIKK